MKNMLVKIKESRGKIRNAVVVLVLIGLVLVGICGGVIYNYAKANIRFTQIQSEEIAFTKIEGEIIRVNKEIDFDDLTLEYEFEIKDRENILKKITVNSKSGAITDMENNHIY